MTPVLIKQIKFSTRNKKILKFKKGVGITIKSKETSSKLAKLYLADHTNTTPAG